MNETKEIQVVKEKVAGAVTAVSNMVIKSDDDQRVASALLINVKKLGKFVQQEKEKITKPMNEALKNARAIFKPMEMDIEKAEGMVSRAMSAYADKVEAIRKQKEDSIAKRAEKGQLKEETAVRKMEELGEEKKTIHNEGGSVTFTKIKKVRFDILSDMAQGAPQALVTLAMNGYLLWDEVKARKDALAGREIFGVTIYEETSTNTRS
jgi:hypothetical protein